VLAAGYDTPPRAPFSQHTFSGANTLMLEMMRDYRDTLNINASEQDFNAAIDATMNMLQWQTLNLELSVLERDADTLKIEALIENLAGHQFPSGYPARRAFIRIEAHDELNGNTLFVSGAFDEQAYLIHEDAPYEPHYDVIRSEQEVQIYEMVMADVNGNPTTLLEQGAGYLKDNRLVPVGFSTSHAVYDTTLLAGSVLNDPNFNHDAAGNEGTGTDRIRYHIPLQGFTGAVSVQASVFYQAIPPKWVDDIAPVNDPMVEHFVSMYSTANKAPVLVKSAGLNVPSIVSVHENSSPQMAIVTKGNGQLLLHTEAHGELVVYGLTGRMVIRTEVRPGESTITFTAPFGVYVATLVSGEHKRVLKFVNW
jgi:hypothetical protein